MIKKVLVLGSQGQIQQLQTGDSVPVTPQFEAENGDGTSHVPGTVVYIFAGTTVKAAIANSYVTVRAAAISTGTIAAGAVGLYQYDGLTGGYAGLTPGSTYFLSVSSAGAVTPTPPTGVGEWIMQVGVAYSTTELDIEWGQPIEL